MLALVQTLYFSCDVSWHGMMTRTMLFASYGTERKVRRMQAQPSTSISFAPDIFPSPGPADPPHSGHQLRRTSPFSAAGCRRKAGGQPGASAFLWFPALQLRLLVEIATFNACCCDLFLFNRSFYASIHCVIMLQPLQLLNPLLPAYCAAPGPVFGSGPAAAAVHDRVLPQEGRQPAGVWHTGGGAAGRQIRGAGGGGRQDRHGGETEHYNVDKLL